MQLDKGSQGFALAETILAATVTLLFVASMMAYRHASLLLLLTLVVLCVVAPLFIAWGAHTLKKRKPDITNYRNRENRRVINYFADWMIFGNDPLAVIPGLIRCVEITFSDGRKIAIREQCGYPDTENGCFRSIPETTRTVAISGERENWHPISLEQFRHEIELHLFPGDEIRVDYYGISRSIHRTGFIILEDLSLPQ